MLWRSASAVCIAAFAAAAHGQFPLGPGPYGPNPVVDPSINDFICRSVVEHAIGSHFAPKGNAQVELVSARWQGDLVFVFSRVHWTTNSFWKRTPTPHVAEVQYSMVQRRFRHMIYDLWCINTRPTIYNYYDLGRIRTKINDELTRFDKIAGDNLFPGPYPIGPSTVVPQVGVQSTIPNAATPTSSTGQPVKLVEEPSAAPPPKPAPPQPQPPQTQPPAPAKGAARQPRSFLK